MTARSGMAAGVALAILVPLILATSSTRLVNGTLADLPTGSGSVEGFEALTRHFPPGHLSPVVVVIDADQPVTDPASFRALGDLSRNLRRLESVVAVCSAAMPTNGATPDLSGSQEVTSVVEQVDRFEQRLGQAADGAEQLADGIARVQDGLAQIDARLPELTTGLGEATNGSGQLAAGAAQLRDGVGRLDDGLGQLASGIDELRDGLAAARDGAVRLRDDVAAPAEESVREAWQVLMKDFTVGRADPAYREALEAVGRSYGRLTGQDPRTGEQVEPGYEGLTAALDELATGLGEAQPSVQELADGVPRLHAGASRLEAGARELAGGLQEGVARLRDTGFENLVPGGEDDGPFVLTAAMLGVDDVRERLDLFLAEDETRTRVMVSLDASPFSPEALAAVREIEEVATFSVQGSPLADATLVATGTSAFLGELDEAAAADLPLIVAAVLLGVLLVLVALLRALVAPVYMVLTTLLSYGAALGVTTVVFQWILGDAGLAWWIPPFLFVILVGPEPTTPSTWSRASARSPPTVPPATPCAMRRPPPEGWSPPRVHPRRHVPGAGPGRPAAAGPDGTGSGRGDRHRHPRGAHPAAPSDRRVAGRAQLVARPAHSAAMTAPTPLPPGGHSDPPDRLTPFQRRVVAVVSNTRPGDVLTYAEVALEADHPGSAQAVANVLRRVPGLPWWRVVPTTGRLYRTHAPVQAPLLEAEGAHVDDDRRVHTS